jgi:hypothetical protein
MPGRARRSIRGVAAVSFRPHRWQFRLRTLRMHNCNIVLSKIEDVSSLKRLSSADPSGAFLFVSVQQECVICVKARSMMARSRSFAARTVGLRAANASLGCATARSFNALLAERNLVFTSKGSVGRSMPSSRRSMISGEEPRDVFERGSAPICPGCPLALRSGRRAVRRGQRRRGQEAPKPTMPR